MQLLSYQVLMSTDLPKYLLTHNHVENVISTLKGNCVWKYTMKLFTGLDCEQIFSSRRPAVYQDLNQFILRKQEKWIFFQFVNWEGYIPTDNPESRVMKLKNLNQTIIRAARSVIYIKTKISVWHLTGFEWIIFTENQEISDFHQWS